MGFGGEFAKIAEILADAGHSSMQVVGCRKSTNDVTQATPCGRVGAAVEFRENANRRPTRQLLWLWPFDEQKQHQTLGAGNSGTRSMGNGWRDRIEGTRRGI